MCWTAQDLATEEHSTPRIKESPGTRSLSTPQAFVGSIVFPLAVGGLGYGEINSIHSNNFADLAIRSIIMVCPASRQSESPTMLATIGKQFYRIRHFPCQKVCYDELLILSHRIPSLLCSVCESTLPTWMNSSLPGV
jgi:hypothetical protein